MRSSSRGAVSSAFYFKKMVVPTRRANLDIRSKLQAHELQITALFIYLLFRYFFEASYHTLQLVVGTAQCRCHTVAHASPPFEVTGCRRVALED